MLDYYAIQGQDYGDRVKETRKACWYLCKYGGQLLYFVERMTIRELYHGVKEISDFLDAEARAVRRAR